MRSAFFNTVIIAFVILGIARGTASEPLITVAPSQLNLHPSEPEDQTAWRSITLSISNRTARKWRVSNFYDSWKPVLLSERQRGELVPISSGGRDATKWPKSTDFPHLAPGERAVAKRYFRLDRFETGLVVTFADGTGGIAGFAVTPGRYKLCVSYQADLDSPLFQIAAERFGLKAAEVWPGWQMSNWIDIVIHGK